MERKALHPGLINWIVKYGHTKEDIMGDIREILKDLRGEIDESLYPIYESIVDNPSEEIIRRNKLGQFNSFVTRKASENVSKFPRWNDTNADKIGEYLGDSVININGINSRNFDYPSWLTSDGFSDVVNNENTPEDNKYIIQKREHMEEMKESQKKHKGELEEQHKHDKEQEIENLSKLKNKLENRKETEGNSEMKSFTVPDKFLQLGQKEYVKRKLREGAYRLNKDELSSKILKDIEDSKEEVVSNGINRKNYKRIVDEIYNEAPMYQIKREKELRGLMGIESSKLPEGIQNRLNGLIERDYTDDKKRRHFILPKKTPYWFINRNRKKSQKINPLLVIGIPNGK